MENRMENSTQVGALDQEAGYDKATALMSGPASQGESSGPGFAGALDDQAPSGPGRFDALLNLLAELGDRRVWTLTQRYQIGLCVQQVCKQEIASGKARYGQSFFQQMADAVGLSKGDLTKLQRFGTVVLAEEVEILAKTRLANGQSFAWSHARR